MHWQTEEVIQALSDFRAHNRKVAQLKKELAEFKKILVNTEDPDQFDWAVMMFKSIRHELELEQARPLDSFAIDVDA